MNSIDNEICFPASQGIVVFVNNNKYGAKREDDGTIIIPPTYDYISSFHNGVASAIEDGKTRIINRKNEICIKKEGSFFPINSIYCQTTDFYSGLACVRTDSGWGVLDSDGFEIVPPKFSIINNSMRGIVFYQDRYKWGAISRSGIITRLHNKLNRPYVNKEGNICSYWNGLGVVTYNRDGFCISENEDEIHVLTLDIDGARASFRSGYCIVVKDDKYGAVNIDQQYIIKPTYDWLSDFHGSYAIFKKDSQTGIINCYSEELFILEDSIITYDSSNKLFVIQQKIKNNLSSLCKSDCVNKAKLVNDEYEFGIFDISTGVYHRPRFMNQPTIYGINAVGAIKGIGEREVDGEDRLSVRSNDILLIVPNQMDGATDFVEGVSIVKIRNQYGLVDTNFTFLIEPEYNEIKLCGNEYYILKSTTEKTDHYKIWLRGNGFCNIGKDYTNIQYFKNNIFVVTLGFDKYLFDISTNEIISKKYDYVDIYNNFICACEGFRHKKIDILGEKGEEILPTREFKVNSIEKVIDETVLIYSTENKVSVFSTKKKYGLINVVSKTITPALYEEIIHLSNNDSEIDSYRFRVHIKDYDSKDSSFIINEDANLVIDNKVIYGTNVLNVIKMEYIEQEDVYCVYSDNHNVGLLDKKGSFLLPCEYECINCFNPNIFSCKKKIYYSEGRVSFQPIYYMRFRNSMVEYSLIHKPNDYFLTRNINVDNDSFVRKKWQTIYFCQNVEGKWGILDNEGKQIIPFLYFSFDFKKDFFIAGVKDTNGNIHYGVYDSAFNMKLDTIYDKIDINSNDYFIVWTANQCIILDSCFNILSSQLNILIGQFCLGIAPAAKPLDGTSINSNYDEDELQTIFLGLNESFLPGTIDFKGNFKSIDLCSKDLLDRQIEFKLNKHLRNYPIHGELKDGFVLVGKSSKDNSHDNNTGNSENLWGVMAENGSLVIPIEHKKIEITGNGIFEIIDTKYHFYLNSSNKKILPNGDSWVETSVDFDSIYIIRDGLYKVSLDDRWGVIDEQSKIIIPIDYVSVDAGEFVFEAKKFDETIVYYNFNGDRIAKNSDKWHIIPQKYEDSVLSFNEYGYLKVSFKGFPIFINQSNEEFYFDQEECKYVSYSGNYDIELSTSIGLIIVLQNGLFGIIDKFGNVKKECIYRRITELGNGLFSFNQDNKVGVWNADLDLTIEPNYNAIGTFGESLDSILSDDEYHPLLQKSGEYTYVVRWFLNYRLVGVINQMGALIVPETTESILPMNGGLFQVGNYYYDLWGQKLVKIGDRFINYMEQYGDITPLSDHYLMVTHIDDDTEKGCIDVTGKEVIPISYHSIEFLTLNDQDYFIIGLWNDSYKIWHKQIVDKNRNPVINENYQDFKIHGKFIVAVNNTYNSDVYNLRFEKIGSGEVSFFGNLVAFTNRKNKDVIEFYTENKEEIYSIYSSSKSFISPLSDYFCIIGFEDKEDHERAYQVIIDKNGNEILEFESRRKNFQKIIDGYLIVENYKYSLSTGEKFKIIRNNDYELIYESRRYGLKNGAGRTILPCVYDRLSMGNYGFLYYALQKCKVEYEGNKHKETKENIVTGVVSTLGYVYLNKGNLKIPIPQKYIAGFDYDIELGCAIVISKDRKYGLLDTRGNDIYPPIFSSFKKIEKSIYLYGITNSSKETNYGLCDNLGNILIHSIYSLIKRLENGMILLRREEKKYTKFGLLSPELDIILPDDCDKISCGTDGTIIFCRHDVWGFIRQKDKAIILKPEFDYLGNFYEGFADFSIGCEYNDLNENKYKYIPKGGKWGYINATGDVAISPNFDNCSRFSDGMAPVKKGKFWGYVDKQGTLVIKHKYKSYGYFKEGVAQFEDGDYEIIIDKTGTELSSRYIGELPENDPYGGYGSYENWTLHEVYGGDSSLEWNND